MQIGEKIRLLRKQQRITLKEISERTGFSISFISQVERNLSKPSVDSLKRICDFLGVPLAVFFDDERFQEIASDRVIRQEHRKRLNFEGSKAEMFLLSPSVTPEMTNCKIELMMIIAQPGAQSGHRYHYHKGEECGVVVKGTLNIYLDDGTSYDLAEGDSMYFSSEQGHKWKNLGDVESISVWAITPPSF